MSKRSLTELQTSSREDGQAFSKVRGNGQKRESTVNPPDMGEFEDDWEDEIESDEEVVDNGEGKPENDENGTSHPSIRLVDRLLIKRW